VHNVTYSGKGEWYFCSELVMGMKSLCCLWLAVENVVSQSKSITIMHSATRLRT
jgi:hypothetical protein